MSTEHRIAAISQRLEAATPGEWRYDVGNGEIEAGNDRLQVCLRSENEWPGNAPDMELIAHAPADLAFLTAALKVACDRFEHIAKEYRVTETAGVISRQALAEIARLAGEGGAHAKS